MLLVIIFAIFLVPISSIWAIPGSVIWWPQIQFMQLFGGFCLSSLFWGLNRFLALFISYIVFSYVFVTNTAPRAMMCLGMGLLAIVITLAVSKLRKLKWVYIAMMVMAALSASYAILQSFGIDPIFLRFGNIKSGIVGFVGSNNQLGIYSVTNAFWNPFLIGVSLVPIWLSKSLSAFSGLLCGLLLYVYFRCNKKTFKIFFTIVLLLTIPSWFFFGKSRGELRERLDVWGLTIKQLVTGKSDINLPQYIDASSSQFVPLNNREIRCNPWFGYGLGDFFVFSSKTQNNVLFNVRHNHPIGHTYEHAHNDLVEAFYEFGYVGFLLLVGAILSVVFLFASSVKSLGVVTTFSSLFAQAVTSLTVYVFHAPVSLFMFCLTLGLFYAEVNKAKEERYAKPPTLEQVAAQAA